MKEKVFTYLIVGRAIFGIGCETSYVAQSGVTDLWFSGKFLTVAYSMNRFTTYLFVSGSIFLLPNLFLREEDIAKKHGQERMD